MKNEKLLIFFQVLACGLAVSFGGKAHAVYIVTPSLSQIEPTGTSADRPPDSEAEQNDLSILGYDEDMDGVRDDIERYIYENYSNDQELRKRLYRISALMQIFYIVKEHDADAKLPTGWYPNYLDAVDKVYERRSDQGDAREIVGRLMDKINNLLERLEIYYKYVDSNPSDITK